MAARHLCLDWSNASRWAHWAWSGIIGLGWLIGGSVLRHLSEGKIQQPGMGEPHSRLRPSVTEPISFGRLSRLLRQLLGGLAVPEVGVDAAAVEQLLVRAALNHPAFVEHDDLVGIDDRRQAMRDHDRGAAFGNAFERFLDRLLGA